MSSLQAAGSGSFCGIQPNVLREILERMNCSLDHGGDVPQAVIDSLPQSQAGPARHKCAFCAYAAGMNEAAQDIASLVAQMKALQEENHQLRAKLAQSPTAQ